MATLAPVGFRPPSCTSRRATSAPVAVSADVRATRSPKDRGALSAPLAAKSALDGTRQQGNEKGSRKEDDPAANVKGQSSGTGQEGDSRISKGDPRRPERDEISGPGQKDSADQEGEQDEGGEDANNVVVQDEVDEQPEELLAPNAVTIAFPDPAAITREPLVSMVNSEGYSIVSKGELTTHFLPKGWLGTVILKPGESGDPVRLSPSLDPETGEYVWCLGGGEYMMEAQPKQQRAGPGLDRGVGRGVAGGVARSGMQRPARTAPSGFHSAASSFGSVVRPSVSIAGRSGACGARPTASVAAMGAERSTVFLGSRRAPVRGGARTFQRSGKGAEEGDEVQSKEDGGGKEKTDAEKGGEKKQKETVDGWAEGVFRRSQNKNENKRKEREDECVDGTFKRREEQGKRMEGRVDAQTAREMREAWGGERAEEGERRESGDAEKREKGGEGGWKEKRGGLGDDEGEKRARGWGSAGGGGEKEELEIVTDAVLLSEKIQVTNALKLLLQRTKPERVRSLEGPIDGERVLVMDLEMLAGKKVRDGRYWVGGQTTKIKTLNGEPVRSWKCVGGMKCVNEECGYKRQFGKENTLGFEMRGTLRKWFCFHCDQEAERSREACQAVKWTVKNGKEVAFCYMGKHNHDLGMLESKSDTDERQLQVMSMVRTDNSMTPARAKTAMAMSAILDEMERDAGDCVET